MGVDDRSVLEILEDGLFTCDVSSLDRVLDTCSVFFAFPRERFVIGDHRSVDFSVDDDVHSPCDLILSLDLGLDMGRLTSGYVSIHDSRRDTYSLLSSRLSECMESRTVQ